MARTDAVPEVLWQPSPSRVDRAAVTDFAAFVGRREDRSFDGYAGLWEYSVEDLRGFWQAVADYFAVRWHEPPTEVLDREVMPGAQWFTGGTVNYTEHALAAG